MGLAVACGYSGRALAQVASGSTELAAVLAGWTGKRPWLLSGRAHAADGSTRLMAILAGSGSCGR